MASVSPSDIARDIQVSAYLLFHCPISSLLSCSAKFSGQWRFYSHSNVARTCTHIHSDHIHIFPTIIIIKTIENMRSHRGLHHGCSEGPDLVTRFWDTDREDYSILRERLTSRNASKVGSLCSSLSHESGFCGENTP